MLTIKVPMSESFDEASQKFIVETFDLTLEHSLVSLSKWESHWEKPFLASSEKTAEEVLGYIVDMTLTPNVPLEVYGRLSDSNFDDVNAYITKKMTATWFKEDDKKSASGEIITAELLYYWMIALNIPIEFQYWHLNRLLTQIKVCNEKNAPPKKRDMATLAKERSELNARRRAEANTTG